MMYHLTEESDNKKPQRSGRINSRVSQRLASIKHVVNKQNNGRYICGLVAVIIFLIIGALIMACFLYKYKQMVDSGDCWDYRRHGIEGDDGCQDALVSKKVTEYIILDARTLVIPYIQKCSLAEGLKILPVLSSLNF